MVRLICSAEGRGPLPEICVMTVNHSRSTRWQQLIDVDFDYAVAQNFSQVICETCIER